MDLGLAVELAHAHVVDHALPQRGDGGRQWAHGSAPVEERGGLPRSSTWQKQRRREQYGRRRSGYRESGLVQRCTADVAPRRRLRPGTGRFHAKKTTLERICASSTPLKVTSSQ